MELNTDMSKSIFTIITLAAILSLSLFANVYATTESKPSGDQSATDAPHSGDKPDRITKCFGPCDHRVDNTDNGGIEVHNNDNSHHKVKDINKLFRSSKNDNSGSGAIDNIPVIPKMNFDVVNDTNSTATATATVIIPICDGIVPGPCLDKTTGQIIP
jgi:hypothetical protein